MKRTTTSAFKRQPAVPAKKNNPYFIIGVILLLVLLILRNFIGAMSINLLTLTDHLLNINSSVSPILMWGIFGMFLGAIAGSLAIWKKYKLAFKWNYISIGLLSLFLIVLIAVRSPMGVATVPGVFETAEATDFVEVNSYWALPAYKTYTYDAANLVDDDNSTAWMFLHDDQREESVSYLFPNDKMSKIRHVKVSGIRLMNGFNKSHAKWNGFNRVREFIVYHNGTRVFEGMAADQYNSDETIDFKPIEINAGDTIKVNIHSVYRVKKDMGFTAVSKMVPMVTYKRAEK